MSTQAFEDFDPFDLAQAERHHAVMADMRERCPVARLSSGMIAVTRFADVRATLHEPALRNSHAARAPGVTVPPEDRFFFFEYDPPEHHELRRLLLDLLSRRQSEQLAPSIRALVTELLTPLVGRGGAELVNEFSIPLASRLMMRVAGFPEDDAPQWRQWIRDMVRSGFSFTNRNERGAGFEQCYPDVLAYLDGRLASAPATDSAQHGVLARVRDAQIDGEPLTRTQQRMILFSVVSAGTNTLANFMSNTLASLTREPGLFESLRDDRSLVPVVVEESLRRDSPSMHLTRLCAEATTIADVPVAPGEKVLLSLASANRDATVFPDPDEFRTDRRDQPSHVAFGWGAHLCLGAPVARQAGVTMVDTFLGLVGAITLEPGTSPVPYLSPQGNGLDELRVCLAPTRAPARAET
ncbi:cytochrome P450 [Parafrankia sp. EAN1pec]|uniref:cytochrome P450 n=1 Tax=Parafrankia sp. (strain EAN1pec) TaxID=298653 RepID=UPI000054452C|nr:cytochrome P450 [Frankia sp. EAN1pec]